MVRGGGAQSAWLIECSAYQSGSEWGFEYTSGWLYASVCVGGESLCMWCAWVQSPYVSAQALCVRSWDLARRSVLCIFVFVVCDLHGGWYAHARPFV